MSLARMFPVPKVVSLGGRDFWIHELRLKDIALLEAWVEVRTTWPTDSVPERGTVTDAEWHGAFIAAYDSAETWPPQFGDDRHTRLLMTPSGLTFFLWVILHRGQPGMTMNEAAEIAVGMEDKDWKIVSRCAFGAEPLDELDRILDGESDRDESRFNWESAVHDLAVEFGSTYEQIGELTISQFDVARRAGKPKERGTEIDVNMPEDELQALADKQRLKFYGPRNN